MSQLPRILFLHRRPESMLVQAIHVDFGFLSTSLRNHRTTFFMNVQHQLRCLFQAVSEEFLEDQCHVRHQIDGVVPHQHDPRPIVACRLFRLDAANFEWTLDDVWHTPIVSGCDIKRGDES